MVLFVVPDDPVFSNVDAYCVFKAEIHSRSGLRKLIKRRHILQVNGIILDVMGHILRIRFTAISARARQLLKAGGGGLLWMTRRGIDRSHEVIFKTGKYDASKA